MVAAFVAGLEPAVSSVRLESYRPPAGTALEMLVNYLWNVELSEALYPSLHAAEVSFRSSIHAAASAHYGTEFWFDRTDVLLLGQKKSVAVARQKVITANNQPTASRIVAQLHSGFWTSLFNDPYERMMPSKPIDRLYWHDQNNRPALLLVAFPHLARQYRSRRKVYGYFDVLREFRNRVAHHEPIWARPYLDREHRQIHNAIGWVSPQMREAISLCDRFGDVHQNGRARIEAAIKSHLDI
ncbi:MAG: hypothetical protein M3462_15220 [Chloroflexota bacterium]|nr:hypothetical protein [Chloroflexota bacterium]